MLAYKNEIPCGIPNICFLFAGDKQADSELELGRENFNYSYDCLKDLDPVAANRIHPNDHRKVLLSPNCFVLLCSALTIYIRANFNL